MKVFLDLTRSALSRFSLGLELALFCASFAGAQSMDDVHIAPRQIASERASGTDASFPSSAGINGHTESIRVNVDLVLVPVTVTDAMNRPVINLQKEDFALYETGKPQEIRYFYEDDGPVSVAVLFDTSQSMSSKIDVERAALQAFFNTANPQDEYFIISFSNRPRLIADSTESIDEMERQLMASEPGGATAMLDAVYLAETALARAKYKRRAIVIFSDGGDNVSHYTHREIKDLVQEADAQVFAIGLFEPSALSSVFFGPLEEKLGKKWLSDITDCTGGRTIVVENTRKLSEAAATLSREMRSQYVLGYRPSAEDTGKWRKIKVTVASSRAQGRLHPAYKQGYISLER